MLLTQTEHRGPEGDPAMPSPRPFHLSFLNGRRIVDVQLPPMKDSDVPLPQENEDDLPAAEQDEQR